MTWCRSPHIEISYEDLLRDPTHFDTILDFLAIEPSENASESSVVKIRKGGHRNVIINYDEVKELLASSKFAGMLE